SPNAMPRARRATSPAPTPSASSWRRWAWPSRTAPGAHAGAGPAEMDTAIQAAQQAIVDEFALLGDWSERYQYLIELGRRLPPFPDAWRSEANRLHGCQSMVWIVPEGDAERLDFHAASD